MGERLVIEIKEDNKRVATCYYHWSGFTRSALELCETVLKELDEGKSYMEALKATGAAFPGVDRNEGLIDTEKEKMENSIYWAEELFKIKIKDGKVGWINYDRLFNNHFYWKYNGYFND